MSARAGGPSAALPRRAYFDADWWSAEQERLFGATYNLVAYESDLPEPGDYVVARVGREPVLVVRDQHGEVRSFVNMCRHRGLPLACGPGHADGALRCAYHGWEFGLDGRLSRVPQRRTQFPDLDATAHGLIPLAVGRWAGMVFVHPGEDAPPFDQWLGAVVDADKGGPFPWAELVEVARIDVPLRCNWKLYIENHVDIYHLWYLHDQTLRMYDHHALSWWRAGLHWGCVEPLRPGEQRVREGMLPITSIPPAEVPLLRANLLFPNVPMTTMETTVTTYQVVPTGPETCRLDIRVRGLPGSVFADPAALLKILRDEDGGVCEQLQETVRSTRFEVGSWAADHELPIRLFHRDVLAHLGG